MNINFNKFINTLSEQNHFKFYSSIFRIFVCFHLLKDLYYYWDYIPIIYTNSSFYSSQPTYLLEFFGIHSAIIRDNIKIFICIYLFVIGLYVFGIGRNFTAILLFLGLEIIQRLCHVILNGGDNLIKFCLFYMIFIDSFSYFSLTKRKAKSWINDGFKNFISNVGGYLICIHLSIIYFFSAIHKIHSDVWFNGIATYYTFSLERFKGTSWNSFLGKNGLFVTVTSYFTLLVEISYPFLVWIKRTKLLMIFSAIIMHIGIYIFMMIYDFQIVFIVVQGFFISDLVWNKLYNTIKNKISIVWKTKS